MPFLAQGAHVGAFAAIHFQFNNAMGIIVLELDDIQLMDQQGSSGSVQFNAFTQHHGLRRPDCAPPVYLNSSCDDGSLCTIDTYCVAGECPSGSGSFIDCPPSTTGCGALIVLLQFISIALVMTALFVPLIPIVRSQLERRPHVEPLQEPEGRVVRPLCVYLEYGHYIQNKPFGQEDAVSARFEASLKDAHMLNHFKNLKVESFDPSVFTLSTGTFPAVQTRSCR